MGEAEGDRYFEIQLDRETVALAAVGFIVLLLLAFLVGRWTAGPAPPETTLAARDAGEPTQLDDPAEGLTQDPEDVDGAPLFGSSPVTARGAPPVAPVPERPVQAATTPTAGGGRPAQPALRSSPAPSTTAKGYVVQVAALKSASEADTLRRNLTDKGYPVRVLAEGGFHKVQVGPYERRSEAVVAERRLKREEKLGTWIKKG